MQQLTRQCARCGANIHFIQKTQRWVTTTPTTFKCGDGAHEPADGEAPEARPSVTMRVILEADAVLYYDQGSDEDAAFDYFQTQLLAGRAELTTKEASFAVAVRRVDLT